MKKKLSHLTLFAIVVFVLFSAKSFGQQAAGTIYVHPSYTLKKANFANGYKTCKSLAFYKVSISGVYGSQNGSENGSFVFNNLAPGKYTISVSMECTSRDKNQCENCGLSQPQYKNIQVVITSGKTSSVNVDFYGGN